MAYCEKSIAAEAPDREPGIDAEKERRANQNLCRDLQSLKGRVMSFVDVSNAAVLRKAEHYVAALDAQIAVSDRTDEMIAELSSVFPRGRLPSVS